MLGVHGKKSAAKMAKSQFRGYPTKRGAVPPVDSSSLPRRTTKSPAQRGFSSFWADVNKRKNTDDVGCFLVASRLVKLPLHQIPSLKEFPYAVPSQISRSYSDASSAPAPGIRTPFH